MITLLIAWATSQIALILTGGGGIAAIAMAMLNLLKPEWLKLAKWGGAVLIVLAAFIFGYRVADNAAEQKALIDSLQTANTSLTTQLNNQKEVATFAAGERDRLREEKNTATATVDEYKALIATMETKAPDNAKANAPSNACTLNDADLRFRRSVQRPKKGP